MGVGGGKSVPKSRPLCNQWGGVTDARMECSGLPPAKGLAPIFRHPFKQANSGSRTSRPAEAAGNGMSEPTREVKCFIAGS